MAKLMAPSSRGCLTRLLQLCLSSLLVFWKSIAVAGHGSSQRNIRVGGVFDDVSDVALESMFRYAIWRLNDDDVVLRHTRLDVDVQRVSVDNSFLATKRVCEQAGAGVVAIVGPRSPVLTSHISSICTTLEIPHIQLRPGPLPPEIRLIGTGPRTEWISRNAERQRWNAMLPQRELFAVNVYPDQTQMMRAVLDVIAHYRWTKAAIIYSDANDLLQLQDVLLSPASSGLEISVRQVARETMRESLKELTARSFDNIIIHLSVTESYLLLKAALQIGTIDAHHHYVVTNLDFDAIGLDDFSHNLANITGFRLVDYEDARVRDTLHRMTLNSSHSNYAPLLSGVSLLHSVNPLVIKSDVALLYDAMYVLAYALVEALEHIPRLTGLNISCDDDQAWAYGSSFYSHLNLVDMEGLTGRVSFDRGRRKQLRLGVVQARAEGIIKVGEWNSVEGLNFTGASGSQHHLKTLANVTLRVTSLLEPPYVMRKKQEHLYIGNDRYEGFCIDLLKEIAQIVGFTYTIELVPDGKYGSKEKGQWSGLVRELLDGRADLAVTSLTINYLREQVIDFTKPFMNLGISILFKRPRRESPGLFSFLNPLAIEIWLYVIAAYVIVSLMMYVLARFSPYEWYNPHPCNPDFTALENVFTMSNSFWFAVGTLMQQGSDINPRAVSTRLVGGLWWFFTLIIISSYTANLAAFLTVERMVSPIESAEDLSKQTTISYGTIAGGSTMTFFRDSKLPTYQRMWAYMESQLPKVFVETSQEGIDRVINENYAFLMESTMIEYTIQRNCELMQVGGLLDSKGYGIGTPSGSPYRDTISMAILELQENGRIQMMYNKWWRNAGTCAADDKKKDNNKANSLGVANVGGIFVMLFVGLALAVVVAVVEFVWDAKHNRSQGRRAADNLHSRAHILQTDSVRIFVADPGRRAEEAFELQYCIFRPASLALNEYLGKFRTLQQQQSIWTEMIQELRFAVRCCGTTTKPRLERQCPQCTVPSVDQSEGAIRPTPPNTDHTGSASQFPPPPPPVLPHHRPSYLNLINTVVDGSANGFAQTKLHSLPYTLPTYQQIKI